MRVRMPEYIAVCVEFVWSRSCLSLYRKISSNRNFTAVAAVCRRFYFTFYNDDAYSACLCRFFFKFLPCVCIRWFYKDRSTRPFCIERCVFCNRIVCKVPCGCTRFFLIPAEECRAVLCRRCRRSCNRASVQDGCGFCSWIVGKFSAVRIERYRVQF